jgi:predicted Na+-dependent transporter
MTARLFVLLVPISLVLITFGLGMTLERRDVLSSLRHRGLPWLGVVLWIVFPATAFALAAHTSAQRDVRVGIAILGAVPVGFIANVFASYVGGQVAVTLCAVGITTLVAPIVLGLWGSAIAAYFGIGGPTQLMGVASKVLPILVFGTLPAIGGYLVGARIGSHRLRIARLLRDGGTLCLGSAFMVLMAGDIHAFAVGIREAAVPVLIFDAICVFVGWICSRRIEPPSAARSAWLTCFLRQEETGIFFATTCLGLPGATAPLLVNVMVAMSLGVAFTVVARLLDRRTSRLG